jgi:hypothetical protein
MKTPNKLSKQELIEVVSDIQEILYLENGKWNVDKQWDSETMDEICDVLGAYDLIPELDLLENQWTI